jgi:hypothetical protein
VFPCAADNEVFLSHSPESYPKIGSGVNGRRC